MDADGGMSRFPGNKADAKYGIGYCDAQCHHSVMFIMERPTVKTGTLTNRPNTMARAAMSWISGRAIKYPPPMYPVQGQTRCEGTACGDDASGQRYNGICDKDGCDFNPYRLGNKTFFGPYDITTVDSTKPFTVVMQFITTDGTDYGDFSEIRRVWMQNGSYSKLCCKDWR